MNRVLIAFLGVAVISAAIAQDSEPRPVELVRTDAKAVMDLVDSDFARSYLLSAQSLPEIEGERIVFWNSAERKAISEEAAQKLDEEALGSFRRMELDEEFYYNSAYGSPIAYCRAFDLAGKRGITSADGARILDFGFGGIGHLRMLASLGADCVGLEVLELLREFYSEPGDTGAIDRAACAGDGERGTITLLYGRYPAEEPIRKAVGAGYDLVVSKNTLKLGYIHPEREATPRSIIDLGCDDETFVRTVFDALNPGGLFVVYNIYPKQAPPDEPYITWATGGFPFDRALTEKIGFEIVDWNIDDSEKMRQIAVRLGWEEQLDLADIFAMYTIVRKPSR